MCVTTPVIPRVIQPAIPHVIQLAIPHVIRPVSAAAVVPLAAAAHPAGGKYDETVPSCTNTTACAGIEQQRSGIQSRMGR